MSETDGTRIRKLLPLVGNIAMPFLMNRLLSALATLLIENIMRLYRIGRLLFRREGLVVLLLLRI